MSKNITITREKTSVHATYLPYAAYKAAVALATEMQAKIGKTAEGNFMATFNSVKTAEKFVKAFNEAYEANRKVEVAPAPTKKPTASKGKTETVTVVFNGVEYTVNKADLVPASSTKKTTAKKSAKKSTTSSKKAPSKAKGAAFDYSVIKGKTTADKNKALHKELVKMGLKDSRTPEYMSIWNARPWAKA